MMVDECKCQAYAGMAMLLVGSTVVVSKLIAAGAPPFAATALRFALALPLLLGLLRWRGLALPRPDRHDQVLLWLQAGAGSVGYTVLLIKGLAWVSAADAGVLTGTLPAVAALFAVLALGERPAPATLAAIALASLGVLALNLRQAGIGLGWGQVLLLGAVLCEALFILLNKKLRRALHPLQLATLMVGGGLLLALPMAALELAQAGGRWMSPAALAGIAYYALVPTVLGFVLWYAGAARISAAQAALLTALMPASALLLSALVLGEPITGQQLLGLALVLAAMALLAWAQRRASTHQ